MSNSAPEAERILRRLEWTVIRRLDGVLQGDYRSLFRGFGLDFADLREYQPADDVRHIDWNVTARTNTPHVRVYNEDRDVTAWFLIDLSPSVDFGSSRRTKRQLAAEFTAVIARLLTRQGNKVGLILHDGVHSKVLPPRAGRLQVLHVLEAIRAFPHLLRAPETDLGELIRRAGNIIKRRSIVFVISDFVSTPGWERVLSGLARRNEPVAVRLVDPMDVSLPDIGLMTFQDAETGQQVMIDTSDKGFRRRFAREAERAEEAFLDALSQAGVDAVELSTGDDLLDAIQRFVGLRKMQTRLNAGGGVPQTSAAG